MTGIVRLTRQFGREIYLIDIQGDLERSKAEMNIGDLTIVQSTEKRVKSTAKLIVGNQCLEGTVEPLKQPMVILSKTNKRPRLESAETNPTTYVSMVSVIREKITFHLRPQLIHQ
ncbi:DNA replication factor C complex subunit Ctf8 [Schizosaccharomyces japonicus yFS275]|uniref:DNA replication factor C complex subunit Ctf8 n=1 Tax=Schizosaccharomyces japonicus (strain yFS275 / FY16936) TaxID=402676 RepID=B6K2A5_SCHJY|nr:DNA replication factor C complex subunit Ctf8 [Schizosaccharomyces japonicus yFS275]EEB07286.1 DNA replication factor C complex subunit Ctf8 [Schizosaccharomyces japonicus yFS275]